MGEKMTLLPCPFCGKVPLSQWFAACAPDEDCGYWAIECCIVHAHEDNEADAVAKWNRRHITQPTQAVDVDSLYEVIRSFGYTTRGQSDEIAEAIHHMLTAALPKDSNTQEDTPDAA